MLRTVKVQLESILPTSAQDVLLSALAAVLQASWSYDNHILRKGVEEASNSLLLASQALDRCSDVQKAMHEW